MKKKILIHSIVFSPDGVSTAYLYNDIALEFASMGYEVVVLTTTPHYNVLQEALDNQPQISKWGGLYYESRFHDIRVIHVPQKKFKSSILRIFGFLYWHFLSLVLGLLQRNVAVILSPSPPLTIGVINILIGKIKGCRVIYNVQEIYPDFLINQGSLKFKPIVNILKSMERFVYNRSSAVTTIDSIFYEKIIPRFKDKTKLHIIPNFVDTNLFRPVVAESTSLNSLLFPKNDVLKVMYAGNIGHAQDWEPLLEIAKKLKREKVEFWVIGEGVKKGYLEDEIRACNLSNIHIIPYQPRHLMPELIAYADIHFIFMSPEMDGEGFPSKVYTIMACAKPLLVISGLNTPIYNFLQPSGAAFLVKDKIFEDKCNVIVASLMQCINDRNKIEEMGIKGYELILKQYSRDAVARQYVNLVDRVLSI